MTAIKPTIVLVPGAWHSPSHYEQLVVLVQEAGYPTVIASRLPSCDSPDPNAQSAATDTAFIRDTLILPQLEEGKDVVLLAHSYGGCPGSAAVKGLSKAERLAQGLTGGVVGIVLICGFLANDGDSLLSKLPGQKHDAWVLDDESTGQLGVSNPKDIFYHDVASTTISDAAIAEIRPQSRNSLATPSGPPAWLDSAFDGRRMYLIALQDHCVPTIAQQMMVKYSGVEWQVVEMDTGHSPFLSKPKETADAVVNAIEGFDNK